MRQHQFFLGVFTFFNPRNIMNSVIYLRVLLFQLTQTGAYHAVKSSVVTNVNQADRLIFYQINKNIP